MQPLYDTAVGWLQEEHGNTTLIGNETIILFNDFYKQIMSVIPHTVRQHMEARWNSKYIKLLKPWSLLNTYSK